ncbi:MAG: FAD-dependent oxidoreductase [Lentisphaeria bacterium]|jgi:nitrite reductase (NADH) large subunit|nr:FAD-dependent oxidoreductase [Lentisphaeria bacterium]
MANETKWRCGLCGYVHAGSEPPEECPVCGAPPADFTAEQPATAGDAPPTQWICLNCNYVHDGDAPPDECPLCGATAECFAAVEPEKPTVDAAGAGIEGTFVVLGAGIAGVSAAEAIRQRSPAARVVLLNGEEGMPYYRLNLTRFLAGEIGHDSMPIHGPEWYGEHAIELRSGARTERLEPATKTLVLADGETLAYDRLVLALGSHPFLPPIPGSDLPGVHALRTSGDAEAILAAAQDGPCVVIGGGVLGMETAAGLARRGVAVTLLESHAWIMPRQLSEPAGAVIEGHLAEIGVKLRKQARTAAIEGNGKVETVRLDDGTVLPARLVVLATGVRPNTHLARRAGLDVDRGVVADQHLRTSDPDIFAAGDVAEHNGCLYGTWAISQFQGTIAGANAAGAEQVFANLPRSNTLKVLGLDLLSVGDFAVSDGSYDSRIERDGQRFAQFVFRDGRLLGAILIGHGSCHAAVKKAVETGQGFTAELAAGRTAARFLELFG